MNVASVLKVGGQTHPKYLDNKKKLPKIIRILVIRWGG